MVIREERSEFLGQIMDAFEDFLEEIGVSSDKNPILTGKNYDTVKDRIEETCINWGVIVAATNVDSQEAIKNFMTVYPQIRNVEVVCSTNDGNGIVIFVGDGYYAISETAVSVFYEDIDQAKRAI